MNFLRRDNEEMNIEKSNHPEIEILQAKPGFSGGAWKVAYADFVTAMMAFFLLMWLLNVTTDEQKNAISNYFDPTHPKVSQAESGAGGVLGGLTMSPEGAMSSTMNPLVPQQVSKARSQGKDSKSKAEKARAEAEEKRFKKAEDKIKQAIKDNPALAALAKNVMVDMTPEGLRIQIMDQDGESMFPSGSAKMYEKTENLLKQIGEIILDMPNEISVRGHTDSVRYADGATYTNWELSTDRSNASRRVLLTSGIPIDRLNNVMGKADTEHLIQDNPLDPRNRRISIILLREELTNPLPAEENDDVTDDSESGDAETIEDESPVRPPIGTFRKTPGEVEFP